MSFRDIVLLKRLGLGVLSFTGALTVLLGGWILVSSYSPIIGLDEGGMTRSGLVNRGPASIIGAERLGTALDRSDIKVETIALGCLQDGRKLERTSSAKQVRLRGRLCEGLERILAASSIVNRANGFEATLFNLADGYFTSDYISLIEGENKLLLEIENTKGARAVTEITILRAQ